MTKLELVEKAIDFAMFDMCNGFFDMPYGCEGCPLWNEDEMDDYGNVDCRGKMLKKFVRKYKNEFEECDGNG